MTDRFEQEEVKETTVESCTFGGEESKNEEAENKYFISFLYFFSGYFIQSAKWVEDYNNNTWGGQSGNM